MPSGKNIDDRETPRPDVSRMLSEKSKSFCVVLEAIRSDVETIDSFTIKFSLLTKTPISKMKHLVRKLPATIWSGKGRSRAEHILALIEEVGGVGKIVESGAAALVKSPSQESKSKLVCGWCGFPVREGDTRCEFCLTPVGEKAKPDAHPPVRRKARPIPPKRLVLYCVIFIAALVFAIVAR